MDENPIEGILRALTIVCGQPMPSSSLCKPETNVVQEETDTGTSFPVTKVHSGTTGLFMFIVS